MFKKSTRFLLVLLTTFLFVVSSISAFAMIVSESTSVNKNVSGVHSLKLSGDGADMSWIVNGNSLKGYKVVWSKNPTPIYPTRDGDKYLYISDPATLSAKLSAFDGSGEYHVRVCEYLDGKCGVYSNELVVKLGEVSEADVSESDEESEGSDALDSENFCEDDCEDVETTAMSGLFKDSNDSEDSEFKKSLQIIKRDDVEVRRREALRASAVESDFSDVGESNENFRAISYLRKNGIVKGQGNTGKFKPAATINRAEFLKIILEAKGVKLESGSACFNDVNASDWFAPYVCTAKTMGLIKGYDDGTYKPARDINLAESSKIIVNSFNLEKAASDNTFWYKEFIAGLDKYSAIPVTIKSFDHKLTRGEMAEMVWRIDTGNKLEKSTNYSKLRSLTDQVKSLTLNVNGKNASWNVDGFSPMGYKVVWSKNPAPTYPTRDGDKYEYLSNPETLNAELSAFDGEGAYYIRVCEYKGGKCGVYSNEKKAWLSK